MNRYNKQLFRLATEIHDQFVERNTASHPITIPTARWGNCDSLHRRMKLAQGRHLFLAQSRLQRDLQHNVQLFKADVTALSDQMDRAIQPAIVASTKEIYHELLVLEDEFNGFSYDRNERTVSVVTEPIQLEGIDFGAFEVRLNWASWSLGRSPCYRVIALDANPAMSNDAVTHPHVQDEYVCEGNARITIQRTGHEGRLLDFFLIVRNLLTTYNPDSPYVTIEDWFGVGCSDCGATVMQEERYSCEKCESALCGECFYSCSTCDGVFCSECAGFCQSCDRVCCHSCLTNCSACHINTCGDCIDDEERCERCHEELELEETTTC